MASCAKGLFQIDLPVSSPAQDTLLFCVSAQICKNCKKFLKTCLPLKKQTLYFGSLIAGWSSPVARQAHNLKVLGSNPSPAPNKERPRERSRGCLLFGLSA